MSKFATQLAKFGLVGLINTGAGLLAIYSILFLTNSSVAEANAIGYAIGFTISFVLNRIWTFDDKRPIGLLLPRYLLVATGAYIANLVVVILISDQMNINRYITQLFGVMTYTILMFTGLRTFVFRN